MVAGDVWTLRRGATLFGSIEISGADFPWLNGIWSPNAAFAEVKALFDHELALLDEDEPGGEWEFAYKAIWRAGVRLFSPDGRAVPEFLLHIDGAEAWFRWQDEPFPEGGVADA
jgi:hypothetical protein